MHLTLTIATTSPGATGKTLCGGLDTDVPMTKSSEA